MEVRDGATSAGKALPLALVAGVTAVVAAIGGAALGFWVLFGGTLTLDFGGIACF